jgi:NAD(P)-dependent dehydrogenase (short-subunit alcohol dehydrogenase family)
MSQHLTIITGHSRGLGFALAHQLHGAGHHVLGIARQRNDALAGIEQWSHDLADPRAAAEALRGWLDTRPDWASATLINNAALLAPPGPLAGTELGAISAAMRVGLEAPALLCAAFLAGTRRLSGPRRIMNISSGLGRRAMAGSAVYCGVKAGLDLMSAALALEAAQEPNGARIVSIAPGIIDTDMQVQLRGADPAQFPEQARFAGFKAEGALATASDTARRLIAYLDRPDFGSAVIADIRSA